MNIFFANVLLIALLFCGACASVSDDSFLDGTNYTCNHTSFGNMECWNGTTVNQLFVHPEDKDEIGSPRWWSHVLLCAILVCCSATCSGLTMAYMTLDLMTLRILAESGSPDERKYTTRILPLVERHHLLLVTLLMGNALANEALPIFLEHLVYPYLAIILSVTLILSLGEILPQAIGTHWGLAIGYYAAPITWLMIASFFVIGYPTSKILDCLLGDDQLTYFKRAELGELVKQHGTKLNSNQEWGQEEIGLTEDEVRIIRGALLMRAKTCSKDVYTPLNKMFSLALDTILTPEVRLEVIRVGHSRIPIYHKSNANIIGLLLTKDLLAHDPNERISIAELDIARIPKVTDMTPLYTLLNQFMRGHSHMAIVLDSRDNLTVMGLVTLEDVIEELLQSEIYDEKDLEIRPALQPHSATVHSGLHSGQHAVLPKTTESTPLISTRRGDSKKDIGPSSTTPGSVTIEMRTRPRW